MLRPSEVLPTPGGAGEAEDRAALVGLQPAHGEEVEDALLHRVEPVMVAVEDGARTLEIEGVIGADRPRQRGEPLEGGAQHAGLASLGRQTTQTVQQSQRLLVGVRRHRGVLDAVGEVVEVVGGLVTQLGVDRTQLLAQEELALRAAHVGARAVLDLPLHLPDAELLLDGVVDALEALDGVAGLEKRLGRLDLQLQVAGHQVGEAPGRLDRPQDERQLVGHVPAGRLEALDVVLRRPQQRLELDVVVGLTGVVDPLGPDDQARLCRDDVVDARAEQALHEDLEAAILEPVHLDDGRDAADVVQVGRGRVLVGRVALRDHEQQGVGRAAQRLFDRARGRGA